MLAKVTRRAESYLKETETTPLPQKMEILTREQFRTDERISDKNRGMKDSQGRLAVKTPAGCRLGVNWKALEAGEDKATKKRNFK